MFWFLIYFPGFYLRLLKKKISFSPYAPSAYDVTPVSHELYWLVFKFLTYPKNI